MIAVVILTLLLGIGLYIKSTRAQTDGVALENSFGKVTFNHSTHTGNDCKECHHIGSTSQGCTECHTKESKVDVKKAFHDNCITCHKDQGQGPTGCMDCHKK